LEEKKSTIYGNVTKHKNALRGLDVEFLNEESGGIYCNHRDL